MRGVFIMGATIKPVLDSPITVANYLFHLQPDISPIKLQKALYFLFAYYGGFYSSTSVEGESEGVSNPSILFEAKFEAWKYGPVIREIYHLNKEGTLGQPEEVQKAVVALNECNEAKSFMDDLFFQINSVSDFSLVERSHQDDAWKVAFDSDETYKYMDNLAIIAEYKEKYI